MSTRLNLIRRNFTVAEPEGKPYTGRKGSNPSSIRYCPECKRSWEVEDKGSKLPAAYVDHTMPGNQEHETCHECWRKK